MKKDCTQEYQLNPDVFDMNQAIDSVRKEPNLLLMFDMKKKIDFQKNTIHTVLERTKTEEDETNALF